MARSGSVLLRAPTASSKGARRESPGGLLAGPARLGSPEAGSSPTCRSGCRQLPDQDERRCMDTEERLIAETAQANRALGASGQSDMVWGHASIRDPQGRGVWMKASGWSFDEVTSDRVALVSPEGEVLGGNGPRHIEYPIPTEVLLARTDVNSVVHTHASAAGSFAALDVPLLAISHDGVEFAEPQIPRFTRTGALISS